MVQIKREVRESQMLGSIPLEEVGIVRVVANSFIIVFDIRFKTSVARLRSSHHLHHFKQKACLVHVGDQLESKLDLLEGISDVS